MVIGRTSLSESPFLADVCSKRAGTQKRAHASAGSRPSACSRRAVEMPRRARPRRGGRPGERETGRCRERPNEPDRDGGAVVMESSLETAGAGRQAGSTRGRIPPRLKPGTARNAVLSAWAPLPEHLRPRTCDPDRAPAAFAAGKESPGKFRATSQFPL